MPLVSPGSSIYSPTKNSNICSIGLLMSDHACHCLSQNHPPLPPRIGQFPNKAKQSGELKCICNLSTELAKTTPYYKNAFTLEPTIGAEISETLTFSTTETNPDFRNVFPANTVLQNPPVGSNPTINPRMRRSPAVSSDNESACSGNSSNSSGSNQSGGNSSQTSGMSRGYQFSGPQIPRSTMSTGSLSRLRLESRSEECPSSTGCSSGGESSGVPILKRKRPPKLELPLPDSSGSPTESCHQDEKEEDVNEISVSGTCYGVYCKRGRREVLEDSFQVVPNFNGDHSLAFFGVYDGHGGRMAAEFAAQHLSSNIMEAIASVGDNEEENIAAVRQGYLNTDRDFLGRELPSGACCVTAVVKAGKLFVANAGDCRAVLSRAGSADALTNDHRASREDERQRIEDLGGVVLDYSGVWRVQNSLAVSRGIGDLHLKEYITAEPDVVALPITQECEFLILASDGLWDVVSNQEAVDIARPFVESQVAISPDTAETNGGSVVSTTDMDSHDAGLPLVEASQVCGQSRQSRRANRLRKPPMSLFGRDEEISTPRGGLRARSALLSPKFEQKDVEVDSPRRCQTREDVCWGRDWGNESEHVENEERSSENSREDVEISIERTSSGSTGMITSTTNNAGLLDACKELVNLAVSRACPDDISVLIVRLDVFQCGRTNELSVSQSPDDMPVRRSVLERAESKSGSRKTSHDFDADEQAGPAKKKMSLDFDFDHEGDGFFDLHSKSF